MKRLSLSLAFAALCLSVMSATLAAATPEAAMKQFLTAMQKKDRKAIRSAIDWEAMGKTMGLAKEKPEQRGVLLERIKIIYVETFALGKRAEGFKPGPVTVKGSEAKSALMQQDPATKKWKPTTQFLMRKEGKNWMIYSIIGAKG